MKRHFQQAVYETVDVNPTCTMARKTKLCKLCKFNENQFVYDASMDDTICRYCGCVQDKGFDGYEYVGYSSPVELMEQDSKKKRLAKLYKNMMENINDMLSRENKKAAILQNNKLSVEKRLETVIFDEIKSRKIVSLISYTANILEFNETVITRAEAIFNNFIILQKIKPLESVVAAVLIITQKEKGLYVNIKAIAEKLRLKRLSKMVNKISNDILEIDNDTYTISSIPMICEILHIKFKEHQRLRLMFDVASKQNNCIGSDTIMALCFYIRIKQLKLDKQFPHFTLEFIAEITNTSYNSLQGYVSKKTKCTLFN